MSMDRRQDIILFLKALRERIISQFESLEPAHRFARTPWQHHSGEGGGEISLVRGEVFEKAAVNWSAVSGDKYPLQDNFGPFFATGVSLITHMANPHAPTVHMNIRYIETKDKFWFGGGYDLTPMGFPYEDDTRHFHDTAKNCLDAHGKDLYPQFSKNAKEYFYIPHRKKERGMGGIFFDHYNTGDFDRDISLWKSVGNTFLDGVMPIYHRRMHHEFDQKDKELQQKMRAHYVEFNLLYDRGTKFGFQSGGNPEAILCSMPPMAQW
ncbi:MAG TPA: oxygen-dependent coproporphyrinogen oxidase [Parachlamydiaceae bacterium]|nr:oxygen-dependent coproporphyrinogen oxidase [Parachlamydiaceae bacterium]